MQVDEMKMDIFVHVALGNKIINLTHIQPLTSSIYPAKTPGSKSQVEFVR
jgi:hypothetical protein